MHVTAVTCRVGILRRPAFQGRAEIARQSESLADPAHAPNHMPPEDLLNITCRHIEELIYGRLAWLAEADLTRAASAPRAAINQRPDTPSELRE